MRLYRALLEGVAPVLEKYSVSTSGGMIQHYYGLKNSRDTFWEGVEIPYLKETIQYLQRKDGLVDKYLFLVTENEKVAIKAAAFIRKFYQEYQEEFEGYEEDDFFCFYETDGEEPNLDEMIRVISLKTESGESKPFVNKYAAALNDVEGKDMVLFTGLSEGEELKEKLEAIEASPAVVNFVCITPRQCKLPWVQELRMNFPCGSLSLPAPDMEYYKVIWNYLVMGEEYSLSEDVSVDRLLHKIQKSRGNQFGEEDIAWHLDLALENCVNRKSIVKVMKETDFKELSLEEEAAMKRLSKMTGLVNLKKVAQEMAAITREEIKNPRLGVLHKNMIFVGNPGTGKTTCAKLLADIMADEGNANSVFVQADRRNLIGEYVGQTAPKVAKKFEEARGGVLFVDEAGFFLNKASGGYVTEAVKEFVRYMELYPDVTVIFALYWEELNDFLELDTGLSSRISRLVRFEDYSPLELAEITEKILKEKGYSVSEEVKKAIQKCLGKIKVEKKNRFGNAREARNLAEAMIVTTAIRQYGTQRRRKLLNVREVEDAYTRLYSTIETKQKEFGFHSNLQKTEFA